MIVKSAVQLPEYCYSVLPSNTQLIRIDRHGSGYNPVRIGDEQRHVFGEEARSLANELNKAGNISPSIRSAMESGSMFGWGIPAADPEHEINKQAKEL